MKRKILAKSLKKLCKKHRVRLTVKRNGKLVYKSRKLILKQLKRRMQKRSKFGECGCKASKFSFGRKRKSGLKRKSGKKDIRKLHKLCRLYGVKVGKKSPKVLKKQCIKRIKSLIKQIKNQKKKKSSRFGLSVAGLIGVGSAKERGEAAEKKRRSEIELAKIEKIETLKLQNQGANAVALAQIESNRKIEQQKIEMEKQRYKDEMRIKEIEAKALRDCSKQAEIKAVQDAKKKQKEAEQAAKEAEKISKQTQKAVDNHEEAKNDVEQATAFGKRRKLSFGKRRKLKF